MLTRKRSEKETSAPFWQQPSWVLSAGFFVVLLVMSLVTAVTADGGPPGENAPSNLEIRSGPLIPKTDGGQTASTGRPEGCRTDDRMSTAPQSAPQDVEWRTLGTGGRVPTSPSAGPLRYSGPVWWCFARTPVGAAMAAHAIPSHMSSANWRTVAEEQLVPGQGRDRFVQQRALVSDSDTSGRATASYAGFRLSSYSKDAATVDLLIQNTSSYYSTSVSVEWRDGDWKVKPKADGAVHSSLAAISGTGGFTMWET